MKDKIFVNSALLAVFTLALVVTTNEASAYVGPGPGMSFITTLIGFVAAILTSLFVIIVYPIRKMLKRRKEKIAATEGPIPQEADRDNVEQQHQNKNN